LKLFDVANVGFAGAVLSMANDGSALDSISKVKQAIILYGGVLTPVARLRSFDLLNATRYTYNAALSPNDGFDWHAIFCCGYVDAIDYPDTGAGWWFCKKRCVCMDV
jgi:hypothetical protein